MTKKGFTWLFMAAATLFNILLLCVLFFIGMAITIFASGDNPTAFMIGMVLSFFVAVIGSMFLYSKILAWCIKKWNLEDKLVPLFGKKRK